MSDQKQNILDEMDELDSLIDQAETDLQDIYDAREGFDLFDTDMSGLSTASNDNQERFWLLMIVVLFAFALLTSILFPSIVSFHERRADQVVEIAKNINLVNTSAEQSLTAAGSFESVKASMLATEEAINKLTSQGSITSTMSAFVFGHNEQNQQLVERWADYKNSAQRFLENESSVTQFKSKLGQLTNAFNSLVGETVSFVEAVAREGTNENSIKNKNKYLFLTSEAANLNGILSRINTSIRDYFTPNSDLSGLIDTHASLSVRLQETLNRIVSNSTAVVGTAAEPLEQKYKDMGTNMDEIGERSIALSEARSLLAEMKDKGAQLSQQIVAVGEQSELPPVMKIMATVLPIGLALLGVFFLFRYSRAQATELTAHDAGLEVALAEQQESILKLLDEISALADGDLTVEAEVTDQITGAIADSVNFAVMEMRELVTQINRASIEVANESELAVSSAQSLSKSNISQADQISQAANLMERVSNEMRTMSEQAANSSAMATESLQVAEQGTQAVRDTIKGMDDMREQIQETSKRIKRLGESSQRIGDIVALIDDIAEQTNILSLNAAIQASMAGEAGRGFAVVSDEVQSLAERSTEATKKIAELVTTIQNDTNDAVTSMEQATQQVVNGTKVADTAGGALAEIETVSQRLSSLVENISKGSTEQAELVSRVSEQVAQVSDSSTDTSRKAQDSANSIAKLLELAKDLEKSVTRFKLPSS